MSFIELGKRVLGLHERVAQAAQVLDQTKGLQDEDADELQWPNIGTIQYPPEQMQDLEDLQHEFGTVNVAIMVAAARDLQTQGKWQHTSDPGDVSKWGTDPDLGKIVVNHANQLIGENFQQEEQVALGSMGLFFRALNMLKKK